MATDGLDNGVWSIFSAHVLSSNDPMTFSIVSGIVQEFFVQTTNFYAEREKSSDAPRGPDIFGIWEAFDCGRIGKPELMPALGALFAPKSHHAKNRISCFPAHEGSCRVAAAA